MKRRDARRTEMRSWLFIRIGSGSQRQIPQSFAVELALLLKWPAVLPPRGRRGLRWGALCVVKESIERALQLA